MLRSIDIKIEERYTADFLCNEHHYRERGFISAGNASL